MIKVNVDDDDADLHHTLCGICVKSNASCLLHFVYVFVLRPSTSYTKRMRTKRLDEMIMSWKSRKIAEVDKSEEFEVG